MLKKETGEEMKKIVSGLLVLIATGLQAATVTYDFDSGLTGSTGGSLTVGALSFTHGSNSEASASRNAQRAWFDGDASGDDFFYISGRSSDNKVNTLGAGPSLDMTLGNPSYLSFSLSPASGSNLDFTGSSLSLNAVLYRDNTTSFSMVYQVWADAGSGWTALGSYQTLVMSGSGSGTIYEVDETTVLTLGNNMVAGTIGANSTVFNFDISSLGTLATNQSVVFAVALSGTRDNHASFNSGIDDIVLTVNAGAGVNNAPAANDNIHSTVRGEDLNVAAPGVLMDDEDDNGDALSAILVSGVSSGSLTLYADGSFDFTPEVGFTGTVSFTYAPVDAVSTGNTATVSIQVLEPIAVERPNILIFFCDDMGIGDSRVYNTSSNLPPAQPTIEAFAASGMVFNDAHTQASLCAPSRYCILTGNYPWRGRLEGGSWHMNKGAQVMPGQQTIAHVLNSAGYHTSIFGKGHLGGYLTDTNGVDDTKQIVWQEADAQAFVDGDSSKQANYYDPTKTDWSLPVKNGVCSDLVGFDFGYMLYGGIQDPLYAYFENDYIVGDPSQLEVWANRDSNYPTPNGTNWTYRPGYGLPGWYTCDVGPNLTQRTMDFIDAHVATNQANGTDDPFFIHYCAEAVHSKHTPPVDFLGTPVAGTTGYAHSDMLFELEVAFSNILHTLETKGLLDDTLVIFTSDNGGLGLNESSSGHNPNEGVRGYKAGIWEGGHRVPLFIKWGDRIPAGSYDHMVGIHDLYATIAQLVGKQQGSEQGLDAVSLLSVLLRGNTAPVRDNLLHGSAGNQSDPGFAKGRAIREGTYKLIWDKDANTPVYLYDLATDPLESVDLLNNPGQAARVARMTAKMNEYVALITDSNRHLGGRTEPLPSLRDLNKNGMDDDWEVLYFGSTNAVNGGALDDYDLDGIDNLLEFAFGSNPSVIDDPASVLPDFGISGDAFEYVYRRRHDAAARNLHYISEQTPDLVSNLWSTAGLVETGAEYLDAEIQSVTNHYSMTGTTNRFFRLKIEAQ
jgi:arylsulfatase A-like enzyme